MGHPDCARSRNRSLRFGRDDKVMTYGTLTSMRSVFTLETRQLFATLLCGCRLILFVTQGMYGKRGETPPLPRNCEARTFELKVTFGRDNPTDATPAPGRESRTNNGQA